MTVFFLIVGLEIKRVLRYLLAGQVALVGLRVQQLAAVLTPVIGALLPRRPLLAVRYLLAESNAASFF